MSGPDGNPYCPLPISENFGPPQDGKGFGVYTDCKALQWEERRRGLNLGPTGIDGRWGVYSRNALQTMLGVPQGGWDIPDVAALQVRVGTKEDGDFGPLTAAAVEIWVNHGCP